MRTYKLSIKVILYVSKSFLLKYAKLPNNFKRLINAKFSLGILIF